MSDLKYDELCPGIRGAVRWLRSIGYETTDSGDGSHHAAGMEGALEEPMVAVITHPYRLAATADGLKKRIARLGMENVRVEASYVPGEPAVIVIHGHGLLEFPEPADA